MENESKKNTGLVPKTLSILSLMNEFTLVTLKQIHQHLNLPKPTVHRILNTLIQQNFVIKHQSTHFYSITSKCQQLSSGVDISLYFIESARKQALSLTDQFHWPVAIATQQNGEMIIRFSSRNESKFSFIKNTVGKRYPLIGSALGEVWLANAPRKIQRDIIKKISINKAHIRLKQVGHTDLISYLDDVRQCGHAIRLGSRSPGESSHLAVAVIHKGESVGSIGLSAYANIVKEDIGTLYLEHLEDAKRKVTEKLSQNFTHPN